MRQALCRLRRRRGRRDYNTANIPENEMRNVHLRPFKAAADSGVATFMSAFCDSTAFRPAATAG
jgi:beta-glucosidase-like glycosyl hydrolase